MPSSHRGLVYGLLICILIVMYVASVTIPTRHGRTYKVTTAVPSRRGAETSAAMRGGVSPGIRETTLVVPLGKCAAKDPLWTETALSRPGVDETPVAVRYSRTTKTGMDTVEFVQGVMRKAWGSNPPTVDLYVRAGSAASYELQWFWASVELYWPTFLGRVIVVLDKDDKPNVDRLVPALTNHSILVAYEPVPNMAGRIFNQVSYLNLDRYSSSEYVVTMDSDCVFTRPVTPDTLFDADGRLILVKNTVFQKTEWDGDQKYFTGVSDADYGQSMTTQPVAFKVASFKAYREYIQTKYGYCYEQRIVEFIRSEGGTSQHAGWFCWMCQLSVFLEHVEKDPDYAYVVLSDPTTRFLRYGMHVTYELTEGHGESHTRYETSVNAALTQSLCVWFPHLFECTDATYAKKLGVTYAGQTLMPHLSPEAVEEMILDARAELVLAGGG